MSEREEYVTTLERDCHVLRLRAENAEAALLAAELRAKYAERLNDDYATKAVGGLMARGEATERAELAERELAEARVDLTNCADVGRRLEIELRRAVAEAAEADTTRREWEVRAAESWKVGRDVGRSTALADVTRAITELGVDVPTDALPLVMDIADMIAKADRESHATGREAGLREAAEMLDAERPGHSKGVLNVLGAMAARMRTCALAPPAAETIFNCRTCPASTPGWTDGRFASPGWGRIDHIDGPNAICPVCAADPTSLDCLREEYPNVTPAAETRDEGES